VGTSDVKTHVHVVTQPTLLVVGYRVGYHVGYRVGYRVYASAKPYAPNPTATGPSSSVAAIVVRIDGVDCVPPDADAARQFWPYSELVLSVSQHESLCFEIQQYLSWLSPMHSPL
jgi:hypothetical protein